MTRPLVTIGILSFNRRHELRHTLERLTEQTYAPLDVLAVDNASTDGTPDMVRTEFPHVRLLVLPHNVGEEAKNAMLREAHGAIVIVLDDDSHPAPGIVERVVEHFDRDPRVAAVAGKILSPVTGTPWPNFILPETDTVVDNFAYVGCGVALRRSAALAAGGYAGFFFIYEVEIELSLRLWALGHRVLYDPHLTFFHRVASRNRSSERQVHFSLRNTLLITRMYTRGGRRVNLTLGALLHFGRTALRGRMPRALWRAWRDAGAQRANIRARRLEVPEQVWTIFTPWLDRFLATSILRRKLLRRA
jgi:GT2 family glycosyltransferase